MMSRMFGQKDFVPPHGEQVYFFMDIRNFCIKSLAV